MDTQRLVSRKFILALLTHAWTAALTLAGKLDAGAYVWVTLGVVGAYVAGNVVQATQLAGAPPPVAGAGAPAGGSAAP